jgi:hypothetical protein
MLHDEVDGTATLAAAKAVANLLRRRHRERRRLLVVEWAQTNEVGATPAQTHEVAHHIHDVGSVENSIYSFPVNHDYKDNLFSRFTQEKKRSIFSNASPFPTH